MILDTNAVSAILAGNAKIAKVLANQTRFSLPVPVLGEYRYGLRRSTHRQQLEELFETLIFESTILVVDQVTTAFYADIRHTLRKAGQPIPENDVWISALALQHRQPVVSRDRHFDQVEGLIRVGW